jgi:hypothetical protein
MSYHSEVKEQPTQKTLSIRTRAAVQDLPQVFGAGYGKIGQYLGELGEQPSGPPFAAYYNMDMDNLDVELGFPVARQLPGQDEIKGDLSIYRPLQRDRTGLHCPDEMDGGQRLRSHRGVL